MTKTKDLQDQDRDSRHQDWDQDQYFRLQDQDQDFQNSVLRRLETETQVSRTPSLVTAYCIAENTASSFYFKQTIKFHSMFIK